MFRFRERPSYRIPQIVTTLAGLLFFYIAIAAQGGPDAPAPPGWTLKEIATTAVAIAGFVSLIVGVGWGLINRKNYDKLKETIDDLEEVAESKESRITELKLRASETEARLQLRLNNNDITITGLKVSNEAVVSQNLQMKAILKRLRLDGKWEGHEDELHRTTS